MTIKGVVICGYPGTGKSSIGGWNKCIDLESSFFSQNEQGRPMKVTEWVPRYCHVAVDLALQGYTVMTSTHEAVIDYFQHGMLFPKTVAGPIIFCPAKDMKNDWSRRLEDRWKREPSGKNKRAWDGAMDGWKEKIDRIHDYGLPVCQPDSIDYDLKNYVQDIQNRYLGEQE